VNHKQQGILQDYGTVMSKENRPFFCGLDIAEYLAVVGMDDVRQRLAGMHTITYIDQAKQNARKIRGTVIDLLF
jgi:hypothetical protein